MITQGPSSLPAAPRNRSPPASSSEPPEAVPKQRTRRIRGHKRKRLVDVKAGMCPQAPLSFRGPARSISYC